MSRAAEEELIDEIYAAALDTARWPRLLESLADHLGAGPGTLARLHRQTALGEAIAWRTGEDRIEAYYAHFHTCNPFVLYGEAESWAREWSPRVLSTADCVPLDVYRRGEFFNDYMRHADVGATLHIRLELTGMVASGLDFGRSIAKGEFPKESFDAAVRLQPHLIRAVKLGRALAGGFGVSHDLALTLEKSSRAVLIVDEDSRLRLANSAGERLLAEASGVAVLNGRLAARHGEAALRLQQLIVQATARQGPRSGGTLSIPLSGRPLPLAVRVSPLSDEPMPIFDRPRLALICVTELDTIVASPEDELRALFGLTTAEARLAGALFAGLQLSEAAERYGVSINTVRVQLARVFDKVGITRQSELVKLMMRLSGALGP